MRMSTGSLKVFSSCQSWLQEYRLYRRDEDGKIVKENDHLMDATRYLVMSGLPIARCAPNEDFEEYGNEHGRSAIGGYSITWICRCSAFTPVEDDYQQEEQDTSKREPLEWLSSIVGHRNVAEPAGTGTELSRIGALVVRR